MTAVSLYYREGCQACAEARELLSLRGTPYTPHDASEQPLDAEGTMALIRPCQRFYVKAGQDVFLWDRGQEEVPNEALRRHFVHLDGFIRVPVLIVGTTAIRGFLPDVYAEVLAGFLAA
jgi:arsenate reductase-like glutaredoxin family protein